MVSLDEEKVECALGNWDIWFWQGKIAKNSIFLFICLCPLVLPIQETRLIMFFYKKKIDLCVENDQQVDNGINHHMNEYALPVTVFN